MNRKIKFQEGGRTTPYNPVGHLTNPEEAERQRIAGNKAARKRTPVDKKGKYWWSEYTDPFTKPVDKFLSGALGPAAKPVQGLLDLSTPAKSINEVLNKPTAGNVINAATDTALTAAGLKAAGAPVKVAQKAATPPVRRENMGKMSLVQEMLKASKAALGKTPDKIKGIAPRSDIKTRKVTSVPKGKVDSSKGRGPFDKDGQLKGAAKQSNLNKVAAGAQKIKADSVARKKSNVTESTTPKRVSREELDKIKVVDSKGKNIPPRNRNVKVDATPKKVSKRKLDKIKVVDSKGKNIPPITKPSLLQRATKAVKNNPGKTALAAGATGALGGYMLGSEKNAKPSAGSQAGGTSVNTSPDGSNAGMDTDLFNTPTGVTSGKRKKKSDPTEGGRYKSYSKDNNDFMHMTQKGYDEMMDDSSGEKAGGRPGRGKLKTQGMNKAGKRKAGFSGRGSGAALRGF